MNESTHQAVAVTVPTGPTVAVVTAVVVMAVMVVAGRHSVRGFGLVTHDSSLPFDAAQSSSPMIGNRIEHCSSHRHDRTYRRRDRAGRCRSQGGVAARWVEPFSHPRVTSAVHLRQVLSNPPKKLRRAMQNFDNLQGLQPGFEPSSRVSAVVAQTGSDAANVRLSLQRTNRKLRPAEVDRLCAAYQAGATVTALAKEFRIYHQTVQAHLDRRGVPIRLQPTPMTVDQRDHAFAMRAAGMLQREIAAELGCSARSVRRALARHRQ